VPLGRLSVKPQRQLNRTVRIATLNVWHRSHPWQERLRAIRHELDSLRPDILGLEEVLRSVDPRVGDDQTREIADGFGYHVAYAPACVWGGVTHFGNALLSRYPIVETRVEALPGHADEARSYVYGLCDTPHGEWPVFVTHLAWRPEDFATRIEQVRFLTRRIDELCPVAHDSLPPVLMGDLNAEPHSEEIQMLTRRYADAWAVAGDGSAGHTWDRINPYTHEHDVHSQRIDYVLLRAPLGRVRIERARLTFDVPHGSVWPSDHFGLVADVSLPRA
jgi:endonuclease/exonuclease/phosphatase family metal-dependent hydrolase